MATENKSFKNRRKWTDEPCFYVSVQRDDGEHCFVLGPFQHESDCREWAYYDKADGGCPAKKNALQKRAEDLDPQVVWYAWGMAKAPNGHREAILNKYFIDSGNTFELPEEKPVNNDQIGKGNTMSNEARKARKAAAAKKAKAAESETKSSEGRVLADEANKEKDGKVLTIGRKEAGNILAIVGFEETRKFSNALLAKRLGKLKTYMESYEGTLTGEQQEIVDKIVKAGPDGVAVTDEEPKDAKSAAADGTSKKDKPVKVKKASRESREGSVLSLIVAMIGKKPATKDEMHEMLMKKFPDRNADTMRNTIAWNLSVGASRHGVSLKKGNDGKWSISKGK